MTGPSIEQVPMEVRGPIQARFTEHFLPPELRPIGIAKAPDGRMWFSVPNGIGVVSPSGSKRLYMRGEGFSAWCPTPDDKGRIWFLDRKHKTVSWIQDDGTFSGKEIFLGTSAKPSSLALTEWGEICVASIHYDSLVLVDGKGSTRVIDGPANDGVVTGPFGAIWGASSSTISAFDRTGTKVEYCFLPPDRSLRAITSDGRETLWMIDSDRGSVLCRVRKDAYREYALGSDQKAYGIAVDQGGDVWGTSYGQSGQFIFKLSQQGRLTWISPPPDDPMLLEIAIGDDGRPWIVDNWVARVISLKMPGGVS